MAIKSSPTGQGYKLDGWPAANVVFWGLLLVSLLFPHFITIIYLLSYDSNVVALHCIWKSGLQVTDICIFYPKGTEGKWWLMWREKLVLKYWRYLAKLLEQQRGKVPCLSKIHISHEFLLFSLAGYYDYYYHHHHYHYLIGTLGVVSRC